jgi:hypothetical protein
MTVRRSGRRRNTLAGVSDIEVPAPDELPLELVLRLARRETDPAVTRWIISALGNHRDHESLPRHLGLSSCRRTESAVL